MFNVMPVTSDHLRACGEQELLSATLNDHEDHLRACGEQPLLRSGAVWAQGSSPRMRRTVRSRRASRPRIRIISAHAENRFIYHCVIRTSKDHLRACGEQPDKSGAKLWDAGSSPRMRRTA